MAKPSEKKTWTTWEELLLACAVKRHGLKDWDSVAMELRNRSSPPLVLTAQICRNKYRDLKRRFRDNNTPDDGERDDTRTADDVDTIPWLEELRKLRVAELKQEVHRHDLSIQSLQLKVKRLEEERERSSNENENDGDKPDLEKDAKKERSENDKKDGSGAPSEKSPPADLAGKSVSGEDSNRENRSFNESNSTENRDAGGKADEAEPEPVPVRTGAVKQDPDAKPVGEDSCNGSSDTVAKRATKKPSQVKKDDDGSAALRNSAAAESKEGTKENSDVQSSASLTKKIRRRREVSGGGCAGDEQAVSPATTGTKRDSVKLEPSVGFLDIFRAHKRGSMFERRLESQKTDNYKDIVRQHVDLETVQTRIDDGSYSSCITKLYLDLLLLCNNAIVFFPKDSSESSAAYDLRNVVLKELKKQRIDRQYHPEPAPIPVQPKSDPEPVRPVPLLPKLPKATSAPIVVVCRKRSSTSAKPSSSNKVEKKPDDKPINEEETLIKPIKVTKEKPVTGVRSMRRSSNRRVNNTTPNKNLVATNIEVPKVEKKKTDVVAAVKRSGAADFLKRIKRNSPPGKGSPEMVKSTAEDGNGSGNKREQQKKRVVDDERKEGSGRKKGGGGGGGKRVKEESSPSKRNVGRPPKGGREAAPAKRGKEGVEAEVGSERPKKRSRR